MAIRLERNARVGAMLKETWERNYLQNRPEIRKLAPLLPRFNRVADKPVLVVGAGPSLNKNITDIDPELYDIIAVDKVVPKLVHEGIYPNYIVALNSVPTDVEDWIRPARGRSTLVMPCTVDPATYAHWRGSKLFINSDVVTNIQERIQAETGYPPLGVGANAGTFGLQMAYYLGYNPVAYAGMDFSFLTREDVLRRQDYPTNYNVIEMTDRNGDVRFLDIGWLSMAEAFQDSVRSYRQMFGIGTHNCTEGGVNYSQHVHDTSLKEFDQLCENPI